jgi:hypothetical protein
MTVVTWALIPCSKKKADRPCPAQEMYWPSQLFRGAVQVAEATGQGVLILSAMYDVLWPTDEITPYDLTLARWHRADRYDWAGRVLYELRPIIRPGDRVVSYLGALYAEYVVPGLRRNGYVVEEPLKGLGQGKRLAWFKRQLAAKEAA